ncbi:membrane protein, putative [Roseobacter sp. MED193]|uniref:membrane protein n=1 Tax=Roseobacter sp. MED193 TaxID=314262 RepID=UPI000068AE57|nr:membrane protein [Roseobacter sp. MED193]EAQ43599.1 membrane protein, putative [Roseobacter sp. MED193]
MSRAAAWFDQIVLDLLRQLRWSFLPPLLIYFAYGVQGITSVAATFFVKEYLDLEAAFLAGLAFWVGLPWALKMPLGHLVDLIWRWKYLLILLGAGLMAASYGIIAGLLILPETMVQIMPANSWYVTAALLAPCGFVLQDVVADAMSVEAIPHCNADGSTFTEAESRVMHTTMQTLGRITLIGGFSAAAALNVWLFDGAETLPQAEKGALYAQVYLLALMVPLLSLTGIAVALLQRMQLGAKLRRIGLSAAEIQNRLTTPRDPVSVNWWYFIGGGAFVALSLSVGLSEVEQAQELVFAGSMIIILLLMRQLIKSLTPQQARALIGTAIIIFVYRATPLNGAAATWFEIDALGFDQQFLSVLSLISSLLTLFGMVLLRPLIANNTIAWIITFLALTEALLSLPNIGLYYGLHNWTAPLTGGLVDARFIALVDTAVESPLGQVAMIPMLAWIARNAPNNLKATFFAVMASFTNLALSASSLGTKYLNQVFVVTREVTDASGQITTPADYSNLGALLITVAMLKLAVPLVTILLVQISPLRSTD